MTNTKTYDGTKSASAMPTITSGSLPAATRPTSSRTTATERGHRPDADAERAVNDGNGGNNYTYTFDAVSTGEIDAEALTITAVTNTKTYDGTKSAAAMPTITSGTLASGDTANFIETYGTPNVGTGLTLTPSGTGERRQRRQQLHVHVRCRSTGEIDAEALTITAVTNTKTYDGTTSAAAMPTITSGTLASGDTANFIEKYSTPERGHGPDADAERAGQRRQRR